MATPCFISDGNISQLLLLKARLIGLMQTRYSFLTIFGTRSSMVMQRWMLFGIPKPNVANYFNFFIAKAHFYLFIIIYVYMGTV